MKSNHRRISAILLSVSFVYLALCNRFLLAGLTISAPLVVVFEFMAMLLLGWGVVKAWQSDEGFSCKEKRTYVSLYCLYLVVNLVTATLEMQIISMALSTVNQAIAQNLTLCWILFAVKLILPGVAIWFACSTKGSATVVFDEGAEPQELETQEAIEELTTQLDEVEEQE